MSNYKYILFDFDGTLTDSSEGIFKSLTYAFESYGHGTPSLDLLKKFIGPPLYHSFTVYCGFDDKHAWEMTDKYRERYRKIGYLESKLYDGVAELLKALKEQGYILATASSKPLHFIDQICENHRKIKDDFFIVSDHIDCEVYGTFAAVNGVIEVKNLHDNSLLPYHG